MKEWLGNAEERKDPLSSIMLALGLQLLGACNTLEALNKSLKMRLSKQSCLGKVGLAVEERLLQEKTKIEAPSDTTTQK